MSISSNSPSLPVLVLHGPPGLLRLPRASTRTCSPMTAWPAPHSPLQRETDIEPTDLVIPG